VCVHVRLGLRVFKCTHLGLHKQHEPTDLQVQQAVFVSLPFQVQVGAEVLMREFMNAFLQHQRARAHAGVGGCAFLMLQNVQYASAPLRVVTCLCVPILSPACVPMSV